MTKTLLTLLSLYCLSVLALGQEAEATGPRIDVSQYEIDVEVIPETAYLRGETTVHFRVLTDALSVPFELNHRLSIIDIVDGEGNSYSTTFDGFESNRMLVRGSHPFQPGSDQILTFRFEGSLEREEYAFLDSPRQGRAVIDQEGALLLSEGKWFPAHNLPLDVALVTAKIAVPLGYTAVGPGQLESTDVAGVMEVFNWKTEQPVGKVPVSVGRLFRQNFKDGPLPLTFYVTEQFKGDLAPWSEAIGEILEYFQKEYESLPADSLNFVHIGNFELPSSDSSGLVLLESSLLDSHVIPRMELARRIARQWWAYGVRIGQGHDAWLQDGFATHEALRYIRDKHVDRFPIELARLSVEALKHEQRGPVSRGYGLVEGSAAYKSVVASKGAWILHMLGQLIGEEKLIQVIRTWFNQNRNATANTAALVALVEKEAGEDYRWFFRQWLESTGVPEFRVDYRVFKLTGGGFAVRGQAQQDHEMFRMPMDVLVETKGQPERKQLNFIGKSTPFNFETETLPLRVVLDPDGKILRDSEAMRVAVLISLGEEHQSRGEFVEAIRQFQRAQELDQRSSLAHYRLGEVFFAQQSFSSSANSFRSALNGDLKPEWVETWTHIHLGKIYDVLDQRERALAEYQKAINTKVDYNGAQAEAERYLREPYTRPQSIIG
jgi:tetratricopeptide (TPR) repeat protein